MRKVAPLAILLNGPLGIGKSTLSEILGESIEHSVTLDGDRLAALNPPPADEASSLHETIALLVGHHLTRGYGRFVINHFWGSVADMVDLERRLDAVAPSIQLAWFRLTLPAEANIQRIKSRQRARAIDESAFEQERFAAEHAIFAAAGDELGTRFDVSATPEVSSARMLALLGLTPSPSA